MASALEDFFSAPATLEATPRDRFVQHQRTLVPVLNRTSSNQDKKHGNAVLKTITKHPKKSKAKCGDLARSRRHNSPKTLSEAILCEPVTSYTDVAPPISCQQRAKDCWSESECSDDCFSDNDTTQNEECETTKQVRDIAVPHISPGVERSTMPYTAPPSRFVNESDTCYSAASGYRSLDNRWCSSIHPAYYPSMNIIIAPFVTMY